MPGNRCNHFEQFIGRSIGNRLQEIDQVSKSNCTESTGNPDDLLEGLLTGNNTTICNFKYLIENKEVKSGDRVITSGTDKIFPPYLPIGKVKTVKKEYLIQKVEVEPFFIKSSIKQLVVIANDQLSDEG